MNTKLEHGNPAISKESIFKESTLLVASAKPDLSSVDRCVAYVHATQTYMILVSHLVKGHCGQVLGRVQDDIVSRTQLMLDRLQRSNECTTKPHC